ncbi:MAG: glutamine synthetase type III, partial [Ruminiclostridium sp.]|nr:glutamine synthetase type III [Ruminiclostridium sp.]
GQNLLNPGKSPLENVQFLTFLAAVVKSVDEYPELLRLSVATAGNDHRLGGNEAPPAVVSVFLGEELDAVVEALISGGTVPKKSSDLDLGVLALPHFKKDTTDRNRTSPFAFTGNKFEFRMVGSSHNVATANIILNTIVAESLRQFADELEFASAADGEGFNRPAFEKALHELIVRTFKEHKRIIFNGNAYDDAWLEEAERRGLPNLVSSVDAIPHFEDEKSIKVFTAHKVFTEREIHARTEILLENYYKTINIEAHTVVDMVKRQYAPAVVGYAKFLCDAAMSKRSVGVDATTELEAARNVTLLENVMITECGALEALLGETSSLSDVKETAVFFHDKVLAKMNDVRAAVDELERLVGSEFWPVPTYGDILFSVK